LLIKTIAIYMKSYGLFFFLFLLFFPVLSSGQFFIWGQAPASIQWKQINTQNFQVIFPEGFEERAGYVANLLEFAYKYGTKTLDHQPSKVSVILHNQTVTPNGFVSWAPRRMEIFTNPPQDLGLEDWLELLVVHEFRHVVQIDKLNQGLTQLLTILFGEQITGVVFGLFVPMWFVEGDAVIVETGQTRGGRGRLPSFEQGLRAQILQKGNFSFDKAFFGSYKDFVPSFYALGYQMVSHARSRFGANVFDNVLDRVGSNPISIRPFSNRLRRETGLSSDGLYHETFSVLQSKWREQYLQTTPTSFLNLSRTNKYHSKYQYPAFLNDSIIVALKTSLDEISRIVAMDLAGNERVLFFPGLINERSLSAASGKIVWSEMRPDPRWTHRSWSEIMIFDYETGQRTRLTRNSRFFAAAISPSAKMIAVIEVTEQYRFSLVILNAENGQEISRHSLPNNEFLMTPSWNADNETIALIASNEHGKRIVTVHYRQGNWQTVFDGEGTEISKPAFMPNGDIVFTGAFSGVDALYRIDAATGDVFKMVSPRFAARNAVADGDGKNLIWQDYSSSGYALVVESLSKLSQGKPLNEVGNHGVNFYRQAAVQENFLVSASTVPQMEHEVRPFRRFPALFNLHSWSPVFVGVDDMSISPGFGLYFQDVLSNSSLVLGYDFDLAANEGVFLANFKYYGWYPVVGLSATTSLRKGFFTENEQLKPFDYHESALRFGLNLPLTFSRNQWMFGINPLVRASYIQIDPAKQSPDFFVGNNLLALHYRFWSFSQRRTVNMAVRPLWGHVFDLQYRHSPFGGADMGSVASARLVGFVPGAFPMHGIRLSAAWQQHRQGTRVPNTINIRFPNQIAYPRGVFNRFDDNLATLTADYAMPLWMPDFSIPQLLYLKRINGNVFFDKAFAWSHNIHHNNNPTDPIRDSFYTKGIEISANMHLLRMFSPIELGVRMVYVKGDPNPNFEFFWGVNFY